jgi:hypothetical protein
MTDSHMCQSEIDSHEDISFSIVQTGRRRREERTSPEEASQNDREPRDGAHVEKSMVLTVRSRRNLGLWEEFASARIEVANKARGAGYTRLRPEVKFLKPQPLSKRVRNCDCVNATRLSLPPGTIHSCTQYITAALFQCDHSRPAMSFGRLLNDHHTARRL